MKLRLSFILSFVMTAHITLAQKPGQCKPDWEETDKVTGSWSVGVRCPKMSFYTSFSTFYEEKKGFLFEMKLRSIGVKTLTISPADTLFIRLENGELLKLLPHEESFPAESSETVQSTLTLLYSLPEPDMEALAASGIAAIRYEIGSEAKTTELGQIDRDRYREKQACLLRRVRDRN